MEYGTTQDICDALLSMAFHEKDWKQAQEKCLLLIQHPDATVSALAVTCLGHIARIHGTLDKDAVVQILRSNAALRPELAGPVEDAIDDINMFVN